MNLLFWIIKNIQIIWGILSEYQMWILTFLTIFTAVVNISLYCFVNRMQSKNINSNIKSINNFKDKRIRHAKKYRGKS